MTMSAPYLIPLATMQPKATTLAFTKLSQQAMTLYLQFLAKGDAVCRKNSNLQGNTQQYAVAKQATVMRHRCRYQNT